MCLEAIWGYNIQTLNCVGYDHNWVRGYDYADDAAPLLPKGTILHIIGYMDNSPTNKNVPDPRNWQGSGNRSVANMFIDLGQRVALTDEQFQEEMAKRAREAEADAERRRHRLPALQRRRCPAAPRPAPAAAAAYGAAAEQQTACSAVAREDDRSMHSPSARWRRAGRWSLSWPAAPAGAQSLTYSQRPERLAGLRGLGDRTPTGRKFFVFGYMNRNWEEELDVPVGPDNSFDAGRRRSGPADALPAAPQPLRLPGAGAEGLQREGRTDLDADDAGQDREGVRLAAARLLQSTTW